MSPDSAVKPPFHCSCSFLVDFLLVCLFVLSQVKMDVQFWHRIKKHLDKFMEQYVKEFIVKDKDTMSNYRSPWLAGRIFWNLSQGNYPVPILRFFYDIILRWKDVIEVRWRYSSAFTEESVCLEINWIVHGILNSLGQRELVPSLDHQLSITQASELCCEGRKDEGLQSSLNCCNANLDLTGR